MKTARIVSLILAVVMLCLCAASCGSSKLSATVSIKFISTDENGKEVEHLKHDKFQVVGTKKEPPTVLMAATQVLQQYEKTYDLTADGNSIAGVFGLVQEDSHDSEFGYYKYWMCTINGKESTEGRQSVTKIYEGDQIVFTWTEGKKAIEGTEAPVTTDPEDTTAEETDAATTAPHNKGETDLVD